LRQQQYPPSIPILNVAGAAAGHHKQLAILIVPDRPIRPHSDHHEQPEGQHCRVPVY
jgi:hypothetical protein